MKVILDSDIIIECLRGNERIIDKIKNMYLDGNIVSYTPVSLAEIYAGIREGEEMSVKYFFNNLNFIPIDDNTGKKAGEYLREYSRSHNVEIADALIAASAFINKAVLHTQNKKHYPMADIKLFI